MKQPGAAGPRTIGDASRQSGVTAKMIRHYESLGLLSHVDRTDAGYRQYTDREVQTLCFIRCSRHLGFSVTEIADLLRLWQDRHRSSGTVRRMAMQKLADLDRRTAEIDAMRLTLQRLVDGCCKGGRRPSCPILNEQ